MKRGVVDSEGLSNIDERPARCVHLSGCCHVVIAQLSLDDSRNNASPVKVSEDGCAIDVELLSEHQDGVASLVQRHEPVNIRCLKAAGPASIGRPWRGRVVRVP